jgi:hypothetical protein
MTTVSGSASPSRLTFYGEATSKDAAQEFIDAKGADHWRVLVSPFLIDSRRVTLYRSDDTSVPVSSTIIEIYAFVLHRFYPHD